VLYEMATGHPAFTGSTAAVIFDAILHKAPTSPVRLNPDVPQKLEETINKALEKDPELRCQSASELRADLKRLKRDSDSGRSAIHEIAESGAGGATGPRSRLRPLRRGWALPLAVAGLLVVLGTLGWWAVSSRAPEAPPAAPADPIKIIPFTTDGGLKFAPQLSPDGEKVAYSWGGADDDNWDVYVKALGLGTKPLRLTENPAGDAVPVWSADGRRLAFVRVFEEGAAIYTVPALGGQESKLIDINGLLWLFDGAYFVPALSWSPDGDWLAFAETTSEEEPARLVRLSLDTLEKQPLSSPPEDSLGDLWPSYSPDGTQLAFVRSVSTVVGNQDVWVQPAEGGEARRLTFGEYFLCDSLAWTADGREILFTVLAAGFKVLRVSLAGGEPRPVEGVGQNAAWASIRGDRMVFTQKEDQVQDIWRVPGGGASARDRAPEKLIGSSRYDGQPAYSPDGRRLAFVSIRSGAQNLWVCDSDGSNPVQLTSFEQLVSTPDWSPDGRRIAFDSIEAGKWNVYVIDADGGVPRRLTQESFDDTNPTWSRDGRWIYSPSDRGGSFQIWKIPVEGGEAVQATRGEGHYAEESWDGQYLYFANSMVDPGIWRVPLDGGDATEVVPGPIANHEAWTLSRSGLYYATMRRPPGAEFTIQYLELESGQVTELLRKEGPFGHGRNLAVSPGEEWILYSETPPDTSELMLVENFR
jgi:Tol biopolymer transport system component